MSAPADRLLRPSRHRPQRHGTDRLRRPICEQPVCRRFRGSLPLWGRAKIRIIAKALAHDSLGRATFRPTNQRELVDVAGYSTFRQVAWAGSFEGQTTVGLGVRARLPFRVFTLTDSTAQTTRLVIDVAHRW